MLDGVGGVLVGRPGAGDGHVSGGHGEVLGGRAVAHPAGEGVAGGGGLRGHGHVRAVLVGGLLGQRAGAGRGGAVVVGHRVGVAVVVELEDQGAVAGDHAGRDGALGALVEGEAVVALGPGRGGLAGGAGQGRLGLGQLVAVAGEVLLVVLDGVSNIGARFPLGVEDVVAAVANANILASVYL